MNYHYEADLMYSESDDDNDLDTTNCGEYEDDYEPYADYVSKCVMAAKTSKASKANTNKYEKEIKPGVFADIYDLLVAFNVTNPADAHAIKKMLMPGQRGVKDGIQDRKEAIKALERAIELEERALKNM
jgi:hypothetical protein